MNTVCYSQTLKLSPEDNRRLFNLCGKLNEHIKLVERTLDVMIKQRGHTFSVSGGKEAVQQACEALNALYRKAEAAFLLEPREIHMYLQTISKKSSSAKKEHVINIPLKRTTISARGERQTLYVQSILNNDINFGIGPAGTGKTYLAVASAVQALESERISRIILVRPIVEAGEKLGFLPGDIAQKIHPYLRPLYDALNEMLGQEKVNQLIEKNTIELLPLAYMRGRSLNDSFIILDEGQNTTVEQMKMFLTRIGFNSKTVITGDITQIDLSHRNESGLMQALQILKNIAGISFTHFKSVDVVRHPLVQTIVEAYERYELESENKHHQR